jgi:hypothetical protein
MMCRIGRLSAAFATLLVAACTTVSTRVVPLDPELKLAPSQRVEILLEKPQRPYVQIALLESRGMAGGGEAELLEDARAKARALGADAIIRLEVEKTVEPLVAIYDPFYSPFHSRYFGYRFPHYYPPHFSEYRLIGGGTVHTLKALAIKYSTDTGGNK